MMFWIIGGWIECILVYWVRISEREEGWEDCGIEHAFFSVFFCFFFVFFLHVDSVRKLWFFCSVYVLGLMEYLIFIVF